MNYIKRFEELNYVDVFPSEFTKFRKEYNMYKNKGSYYVQFTDYKNDVLDRTIHQDPNHSDPSGNYAYPLKYIIDFPSDVWYGHSSKFLRVLKSNPSNKTLFFNEIKSEDDCMDMLRQLFKYRLSQSRDAFTIIKRVFKNRLGPKNSGYWGRMTLQILQVDPFSSDFDDYELRTSIEQSEILSRAGFDAFGDYSKKDTTAVINSREPEQICFLNRKAFTVEKIYSLSMAKSIKTTATFRPEATNIAKRIAVAMFNYMDGDRISGKNSNPSMSTIIYSKQGRSMVVDYVKNDSYFRDKKMGQKFHKADKLSDDNYLELSFTTEKGNINYISDSTELIEDTIRILKMEWDGIKNNKSVKGWALQSDKQAIAEREESKKRYYEEEVKKKELKQREQYKIWMTDYMKWCNELGLGFRFKNYEIGFQLYSSYFVNNINVVRNNTDGYHDYIKTHSAKFFLHSFPDFDKGVLEEFIASFIAIMDKLVEIDKIFIEYNFKNYLDKKKGNTN